MLLRFVAILSLVLYPGWAIATDWGQVGESGTPVNVEADEMSYDKKSGRYRASGNVIMQQGDVELKSRILWWNKASGEVEAEGDVQMTAPDEQMSGSKLYYQIDKGVGSVENGHIYVKEHNLHVRGKTIERHGKLDYQVTDGTFTTCDGEVPSWKFGAEKFDITLGGYARARNTVFYLKDIPSFYTPYFIFPIKTERESGFLIPRAGYSEKRGIQYNGAYYQVLGRNQDATIYFDYLSDMGLGKGLEYRYIFGKENAGEMRAYHISVNGDGDGDGDADEDEERYALEWQHEGPLPGGVRMVADAVYVDDDEYFDDFGEVAEEYNKDKVQAIFSLSKNWEKANLVGQLKYTKDLETDDSTTLQLLPRIDFDVSQQRIGESIFYYAFESEYTNFWREQGLRGSRLTVRPEFSASFQLWDVIDIRSEVGYRDRYYWGLNDDSGTEQEGLVDFSTKVSTRIMRVYDQPIGPISKLRHTISPEITYSYTPGSDQSHLPSFDGIDRIGGLSQIEYALVQRLTARFDHEEGDSTYRDLVYMRLAQIYDLSTGARDEPFKSIRGELTLLPTENSEIRADSTFDVDQGEWSKISAEGKISDEDENSLEVEYRTNRDTELDYGEIDLSLSWLKPVYLNYKRRYDIAERNLLEQVVGVEYRQQCWSALLSISERLPDNPADKTEKSFLLTFTMKGIGPVGGFSGSLGGI